jgi:hypothetical protein
LTVDRLSDRKNAFAGVLPGSFLRARSKTWIVEDCQTVVESRMGAVAWAIRQRSVSHPRSSNRTCRSPASGSPTGFTARYTESKLTARGFGTVSKLSFAPRHSNLRRRLSLMVFAGSSPITTTSPSSKAHQKSGPFPQPALPGFNGHTAPSDSRHGRRLSRR